MNSLGSLFLFVRQISVQALLLLLGIWLTRGLEVSTFGVYALCTSLSSLLFIVGDFGLGGYVLRTKTEISERQWRTVFTLRLISDFVVMGGFFLLFPALGSGYGLSSQEIDSIRVLGFLLPIHSFGLISLIRLERELQFGRIAAIEIAQALIYVLSVVSGVQAGLGLVAFPYAWIAHGLTGSIGYQLFSPWRPRLAFDKVWLKSALGFSLPYQAVGALGLIRDSTIPLIVGALLGAEDVGALNWAQMFALSLGLGCFIFQRAMLPQFTRVLREAGTNFRTTLATTSEYFLQLIGTVLFSLMSVVLVFAEPITRLIFHPRWLPALSDFYLLSLANVFLPLVIVSAAVQNCLGHSRMVLRFSLLSMGLLFFGTCFSVPLIGRTGYIFSFLLAQAAAASLVIRVREELSWKPLKRIGIPLVLAIPGAVLAHTCCPPFSIMSVSRLIFVLVAVLPIVAAVPFLCLLFEFGALEREFSPVERAQRKK